MHVLIQLPFVVLSCRPADERAAGGGGGPVAGEARPPMVKETVMS